MSKVGLFPGSFDPFTKGHEIVVEKSLLLFDEVIIGVGVNSTKQYLFDIEKRMTHINSLFEGNPKVRIELYQSLTVDFCKEIGADLIIRGLRDSKDFQYEKSIAHMNYAISEVNTVFFLTEQKYSAINSSIIREIQKNGGPIDAFVTNPHLLV
ncbi:MAG: pantetheine-phosphate adenylyltransferase [Crocinitomicaceae bacterium]|nr:pantetheine-phosphate adenylyltransferase [Crocinitomicaceae bacterium]